MHELCFVSQPGVVRALPIPSHLGSLFFYNMVGISLLSLPKLLNFSQDVASDACHDVGQDMLDVAGSKEASIYL